MPTTSRRRSSGTVGELPTQWAHRGYLITLHALQNAYRISRDGAHITWCPMSATLADARATIDTLID
jgi:hypothetical protein